MRCWHSVCAPWQVLQMFIMPAGAVDALRHREVARVEASTISWLCSVITPAPQQFARSSSTSSMSSSGATFTIEPCSSG